MASNRVDRSQFVQLPELPNTTIRAANQEEEADEVNFDDRDAVIPTNVSTQITSMRQLPQHKELNKHKFQIKIRN